MDCPECGETVDEGSNYCDNCGHPLKEESVSETGQKGFDYRMKTYAKGAPLMAANIVVYFLGVLVILLLPFELSAEQMMLLSVIPLVLLDAGIYLKYFR